MKLIVSGVVMELVMLVCLAASPGTCREERMMVSYEALAPMTCMQAAQPMIAEWLGDHAEFGNVERWKCQSLSRTASRD